MRYRQQGVPQEQTGWVPSGYDQAKPRLRPARYLFICCPGHSGSTLLDLLLGSHSQLASLGEISHLSKNIKLNTPCTCGYGVRECPVWRPVVERLSRDLRADLYTDPYSLNLGMPKAVDVVDSQRQTRSYLLRRKLLLELLYLEHGRGWGWLAPLTKGFHDSVEWNLRLYDYFIEETGVDAVVDSSKSFYKAVAVYKRQPDVTRVIVLTRDGRGVLMSNLKRGVEAKKAVRTWRRYYERLDRVMSRHIDARDRIHLRYEDLVGDPDTALSGVCRFLGYAYEPEMLRYHEHVHHVTNGNNMRFRQGAEIRGDFSWQARLPESCKHRFEELAGEINQRLGYGS